MVQPLKNREAKTIIDVWTILNDRFTKGGLKPNTYMLDNECSCKLKGSFTKNDVKFQLERPHIHQANAAERAIQTFKAHLKAGLASLDPNFPVTR